MMSTWPDMKMASKPLGPPISSSNCFTGRYSPTYRVPEHQMKRCPTNTVIIITLVVGGGSAVINDDDRTKWQHKNIIKT